MERDDTFYSDNLERVWDGQEHENMKRKSLKNAKSSWRCWSNIKKSITVPQLLIVTVVIRL